MKPDPAALMVAMAVAPGVYARNRMFGFFTDPETRRARDRAALLRGIARHLSGSHGDVTELSFDRTGDSCKLRYRVPRLHLERVVELGSIELACVAYLAGRGGSKHLHPSTEDRALLDATLRRLSNGLELPTLP